MESRFSNNLVSITWPNGGLRINLLALDWKTGQSGVGSWESEWLEGLRVLRALEFTV